MEPTLIGPLIGVPIGLLIVFLLARSFTRKGNQRVAELAAAQPETLTLSIAPFPVWTKALNALRTQDGLPAKRFAGWTRPSVVASRERFEIRAPNGTVILSRPTTAITGITAGTVTAGLGTVPVLNVEVSDVVLPLAVMNPANPTFGGFAPDIQQAGALLAGALWPTP